MVIESTAQPERAASAESTVRLERADLAEGTVGDERAVDSESTVKPERAKQCRRGHPRVIGNVYVRPDGRIECLDCRRAYDRLWKLRARFLKRAWRVMATESTDIGERAG